MRYNARQVTRRTFVQLAMCAGAGALLPACASPASSATPPSASRPTSAAGSPSTSWDALVEAAKKEGSVHIYAPPGDQVRSAFVEAFEKAYPGIKVEGTFAFGSDLIPRLMEERQAGKYLGDVYLHGAALAVSTLKPAGVLAPLASQLVLPEVLNLPAWLDNRLWWTDATEPYVNLRFEGSLQVMVFYNTKLVDPGELTSYRDLLAPKWNGKIVARDLRTSGAGTFGSWFIYRRPDLGPQFLQSLFADTNLTLATDQRQMVDWLAQGRFPLALFLNPPDVAAATKQGLPVAAIAADKFKEGAAIGAGSGSLSLIDHAPHPNAARVYINWVLSRDGQTTYQQYLATPSLRVDISKDTVDPAVTPKPGGQYDDTGAESYQRLDGKDLRETVSGIVTQAMQKRS